MKEEVKKKNESSPKFEISSWERPFREFVTEFVGESDRAAVILGAAKLDYLLYQILQKYLIPNPAGRDELLDGDAPLSTFSSKINMCYRLGLLSAEVTRALHLIRKIRNSFAHEVSGCKLDSGAHRDRVRELAAPFIKTRGYRMIEERYFKDKSGSAAEFYIILAMIAIRLDGLFETQTPLTDDEAIEMNPPPYNERLDDSDEAN